ncbi:MAG: spermidine synthase [Planctomycetota bacterium]|jgi:spermidine synthase
MKSRKLLILGLVAVLACGAIAWAQQKTLYEKQSRYNTILVTEDKQGLRTLWFEKGGARQSVVKVGDPDHIELPYARAMPVGLALVDRPKRVLIVGLGGGTIPSFLRKHYPKMTIDVVDIDPDVVDVAKRFFGFREDSTMRAHVADGRRFIEQRRNRYDIIFLDAFGSENIPYHLATREFLRAVRRALTPEGIVVGNVWSSSANRLYDSMVRTYQEVFDELYIFELPDAGNRIFIALPRKGRVKRDDLARRASTISKQKRFPFDMGEIVTYGYSYARRLNTRGRVLTDKNKEQALEPSF